MSMMPGVEFNINASKLCHLLSIPSTSLRVFDSKTWPQINGFVTPGSRSDPVGGSELDPRCHSIVMPPVGALIELNLYLWVYKQFL